MRYILILDDNGTPFVVSEIDKNKYPYVLCYRHNGKIVSSLSYNDIHQFIRYMKTDKDHPFEWKEITKLP